MPETSTIVIDLLTDASYAGQSPAYVATDEQADFVPAAGVRFVELASPAYLAAGEQVGVTLLLSADARDADAARRGWGSVDAYREAWQAVHDAADIDLTTAASEALGAVTAEYAAL